MHSTEEKSNETTRLITVYVKDQSYNSRILRI